MPQIKNVFEAAKNNDDFRRVIATGPHSQIVLMSIPAGEEIGEEVHPDNDQCLYLIEGSGQAILNGKAADFETGDVVLVPAGTRHNFVSKGDTGMKILTSYAPPHHPDGTVHHTKAEAEAAEAKKKN